MEPTDELTEDCIKYLYSIGSKSTKISEILENKDPAVYSAIEHGLIASFFMFG